MPSQPVLEALDKLTQELAQLEPAIRHIQAARQVTEEVKVLPVLQTRFLEELHEADIFHKKELKSVLHEEVSGMSRERKVLHNDIQVLLQKVDATIIEISALAESVTNYLHKVDEVDFPDKFLVFERVVKDIVKQVETTRQVMVREMDVISRQIIDADIAGQLESFRANVRQSSQSNAEVVKAIKAENLGKRLDEGTSSIVSQLEFQSADLQERLRSGLIKVENLIKNSKLDELIIQVDYKLDTCVKQIDQMESRIKGIEGAIGEQMKTVATQLDAQHKIAQTRHNFSVALLIVLIAGVAVALILLSK